MTKEYDDWVKEALGVDPAEYRSDADGAPAKAGPGRKLLRRIAAAQDRLEEWVSQYRSAAAEAKYLGAAASSVNDPGPKIDKASATVKKVATAALAAIKKGDVAKAEKLILAIDTQVGEVFGWVRSYAVAVDDATVAGAAKMVEEGKDPRYQNAADREDYVDTYWGKLHILSLQAAQVVPVASRLNAMPESDKSFVARYQAAVKAQKNAVGPMAPFLASPAKMEAEIGEAASDQAVSWAEQANTNEEIAKLKGLFNENLVTQMENAKLQWEAAQTELDADDLKDKAVELRAQAEEQEKLLDLAIDLFKAGIEILSNPEEGAANAAAHVFTGALKFFYESDFAKQAEEAEKEAAALHRESVTALIKRARKATDELSAQIHKIGPLSDEVAGSIERNVMRATKRFDTVDAVAHRTKFRFGDLEQVIQKEVPLTQAARNAADNRYRSVWAGAEALLSILKTNLSTVDKADYYGHAKTYKFDQGLSWNRELLDQMAAHIQQMSTECYEQAQSSNKILSDVLSLNARAFSALKKART